VSAPRAQRAGAGALSACTLFLVLMSPLAMVGSTTEAAAATAPTPGDVVIASIGPGYTVTSQGHLDPPSFAANAPDPAVVLGALSRLSSSVAAYQRTWQAGDGANRVHDLLVRFPDETGAEGFSLAAQHAFASGEIVDSAPVAPIPGARRVTYFTATNETGVGEAITMRMGVDVDLLVFFSAASGSARPTAPAMVEKVARAQFAAMAQTPGGTSAQSPPHGETKGVSAGSVGLAVVVVAVLAVAVATPVLLRRRHEAPVADVAATPPGGSGPRLPGARSTSDASDDFCEHGR
jgi:hypothetical protein